MWKYVVICMLCLLVSPVEAQVKRYQKLSEKQFKSQYPQPSGGRTCYTYCLSRGGQDNDCKADCGLHSDTKQNTPRYHDDYYDRERERIRERDRDRDQGVSRERRDGEIYTDEDLERERGDRFDRVDYGCFKRCRFDGDSYKTCEMLCERR